MKAKQKPVDEDSKYIWDFDGKFILDTQDNVFTQNQLKKIKFLKVWVIIGPLVGLGIGLLF